MPTFPPGTPTGTPTHPPTTVMPKPKRHLHHRKHHRRHKHPHFVAPVPVGPAETGGGGSISDGANMPLAAGGAMIALSGAGVGVSALRRKRPRRPEA